MSTNLVPQSYLSINEQQEVLNKFIEVRSETPLKEKLFLDHGDSFSAAMLLASSMVFWRSSYRAFSLNKYSKARITSLSYACVSIIPGAITHSLIVRENLTAFHRPESMWKYGFYSLIAHQCGLVISLLFSTAVPFTFAQKYGIIPVADRFLLSGYRMESFKFYITRLKPYARSMLVVYLMSSSIMFLVGLKEYRQSQNILAKLGRKTISHRED